MSHYKFEILPWQQVGLLSVQRPFPEINLQEQNDTAYRKLLNVVNERLEGNDTEADDKGQEGDDQADRLTDEQKTASFQVYLNSYHYSLTGCDENHVFADSGCLCSSLVSEVR